MEMVQIAILAETNPTFSFRTHWFRRVKRLFLASTALFFALWSAPSSATKYQFNDFETQSCGGIVADKTVEGPFFDTDPSSAVATVRCTLAAPRGSNYLEWNVPANANWIGVSMGLSNSVSLSFGTTYYLAGFFRFQRINSADIWHDVGPEVYSFDKLLEFRGNGFRWGIGAGWNGWYSTGVDHKFTFDAWYASSILGDHGPDHLVANVAPFGASNPFVSDYERWHGVVLGVTANNSNSGRVQLWVNGTKVIDKAQYTANQGAVISESLFTGTVAQPAYDAPAHYRQLDAIMITDNWQEIVDGGYLGQLQSTPPPGPVDGLRMLQVQ